MSSSPRTSSFFDTSTTSISPSPAPRWTPSKQVAAPSIPSIPSPLSLSRATSQKHVPPPIAVPPVHDQLSPLHHSPTASIQSHWRPPLPRSADEIDLRFIPTPTYLLGSGRYAQVYLASYKIIKPTPQSSLSCTRRLCAVKRMASDRESQTMGLREAFFLNRLTAGHKPRSPCDSSRGSVYIIKLIAVKEDSELRKCPSHGRSTSDALDGRPRPNRLRSSTFGVNDDPLVDVNPSLPAVFRSDKAITTTARLILLLEHAPLGTMCRLLQSSPDLVGRAMWERWASQCFEALSWVHAKGIIHADVKPGNILLTRDLNIRLSDFGSSLLVHPSHPPMDGVGLGTLPFSAPELVGPGRQFSFPIDIFALGATLYQCITGREPYRGCRGVEMMHHVRKGDLWEWEERVRLGLVGDEVNLRGSPYPSAWREAPMDGIRRGGSLRVPPSQSRPSLNRMSSAESLRASNDVNANGTASPSGVKLWATWVKSPVTTTPGPIDALLDGDNLSDVMMDDDNIEGGASQPHVHEDLNTPYADGSPRMMFLAGGDALSEHWRNILFQMVRPDPSRRPTADELRRTLVVNQ